jgi:hypothetical protein
MRVTTMTRPEVPLAREGHRKPFLEAAGHDSVALAAHLSLDGQLRHPVLFRRHRSHAESRGLVHEQQKTVQQRGSLDKRYLGKDVAKLEIVEKLRSTHGLHGAVKDFRIEDTDCSIAFKGPGYSADVLIDRATGRYKLTETRMGFFAVLNDLHKGRDSGSACSVVIDVSAVLMTIVSLTGMLLIFFLHSGVPGMGALEKRSGYFFKVQGIAR